MKRIALCTVFILIALLVSGEVMAEKKVLSFFENSNDPIGIKADESRSRRIPDGYETVFQGNVRVSQGLLSMTCDKLMLYFKNTTSKGKASRNGAGPKHNTLDLESLHSATAIGRVNVVYQDTMAASEKLTYDQARRTVTLTGGNPGGMPRMWQGPNMMVAKTIVVYLDENKIEHSGGVNIKLTPHKNKKEKK
jgi:lipopolysaccharide export system protein LptA